MTFITRTIAHHHRMARGDCDLITWLAAQAPRLEDLSGEALAEEENIIRAEMCQHAGWNPMWSAEAIVHVTPLYDEPERSQVQTIYAQDIADTGGETATKLARNLLKTHPGLLTAPARAILEAIAGS